MTYLEEIALAQMITIAKAAAYKCDEQHDYMKGCNLPGWYPHKWVVEAMRAAVSIRNSEAENEVRQELAKAHEEIKALKLALHR